MGDGPQGTSGSYWLEPGGGFAGYPGPALAIAADGAATALNDEAVPLAEALAAGEADSLKALCSHLAAGGSVDPVPVSVPGEDGDLVFDVIALGAEPPMSAILLCREVTFDENLRKALTDSRRRYKDLVEVSSDFAWETDAEGRFAFVSPRGALGYAAEQLVGRRAADFVVDVTDDPLASPFETVSRRERVETWFRSADGTPACLVASCAPLVDERGNWLGARGVCRDVTEQRERDAALAAARNRERLNAYIANAIRNEIFPGAMLEAAATAVARALSADSVQIFRSEGTLELTLAAETGAPIDPEELEEVIDRATSQEAPVAAACGSWRTLVMSTRFRREVNGAVCVLRETGSMNWSEDDRQALRFAADQIALVIEQATHHESLRRMSRTDALTNLLNRRAFFEEVDARIEAGRSDGRPGCLVFIDLDNFKQVNDMHGHDRGDAALRAVAKLLLIATRKGDIVARLGGDEFALWLDGADGAGAERMAQTLLDRCVDLRGVSASEDRPLSFSIGITVYDPSRDDTLETLMARADKAMYAAKRGGKGAFTTMRETTEAAA